jgi:hypothetical protein
MSDAHTRFHALWLGMVQPSEGLVFSVPVLAEAQCMERQPAELRHLAIEHAPEGRILELGAFFADILDLHVGRDLHEAPDDLSLYVSEGRQTLRPTWALEAAEVREIPDDASPAIAAGAPYAALVWDLPPGLPFDKPETQTGEWRYPPGAKFDRLLRASRVPIGLLTNREVIRLVYAPHGQSSGWIDFRLADMLGSGGAPILDAFAVLLRADRWFSVADDVSLPGLLAASRSRQANVTNELADQVFDALGELLAGFDRANDRDPRRPLDAALEDGDVYGGLLTVLLRLVFLLYAEEHDLLPVEHPLYEQHLSVLALYDSLVEDAGVHPDEMDRRFGAWSRLLAAFRAVFFGVEWHPVEGESAQPLVMPAREGGLFDPDRYPWLEGRIDGGRSLDPTQNANVRTPPLDDGTVLAVLDRLIVVEGQRLSYKALDVEQIGSVYERLMGYSVQRVDAPAVCVRPARVWLTGEQLAAVKKNRRAAWLQDEAGLARAASKKLAAALGDAIEPATILDLLAEHASSKKTPRAEAGRLVLQPGRERRRTSSHYTPRSLSGPIVERTLEPLLKCLGEAPTAEQVLELKICDPAMGSGAFLVEACRFLAEEVVKAWTRDGTAEHLADKVPDLSVHARRLVAQRCLYGVDKNPFAVELARMSLWLVTLARDLPFTFVDHALRHGDSLVGLSLEQIGAFHWADSKQLTLFTEAIRSTLEDTVEIRQRILELADSPDNAAKARLLEDAEFFTERARLIADACVGAFFAEGKNAAREKERKRRLALVEAWLRDEDPDAEAEVRALALALREEVPAFHWMLEFPEVFYAQRPDPLAGSEVGVAWMDAFVGNPPFVGGRRVRSELGDAYTEWLGDVYAASKNADISAHFFTRGAFLLGPHGTLGLIATNTIAQGDTREAGLGRLLLSGDVALYDATDSMVWPGEAAVTVSVIHVALGGPGSATGPPRLNGSVVPTINSRLRPSKERGAPARLLANAGKSYVGCYVLGMGFTLTPDERVALVSANPANAERIFPYLGGQEVNSSPSQGFDRYVINFGSLTIEQASAWPDLIGIVREKVKPERDRVRRDAHRKYWWHFADKRPALFDALRNLDRCLVTARVTKHLCFSWQPTDRVFNEKTFVFPAQDWSFFTVLQSRPHEAWTWFHSSTLGTTLNYSATDCFDTFPFPADMTAAALNDAGEALYTARADYMVRHDQGLTATYNQLKDPGCTTDEIEHLRRLHEAMDRAVVQAYGWYELDENRKPRLDDEGKPIPLAVPAYGTADPEVQQAFEDEVIDRLFVLNAERAAEEAAAAPPPKPKRTKKRAAGDDPHQPKLL